MEEQYIAPLEFDAQKDRNKNVKNVQYIMSDFYKKNSEKPPSYIFPYTHKGDYKICSYSTIERFLEHPEKHNNIFEDWQNGETSDDIKFRCIELMELGIEVQDEKRCQEFSRIINKELRHQILVEQKWRCNSCNKLLKFNSNSSWGEETAHIDHIHPFAERKIYPTGWKNINERSNLQALCGKCNKIKYNRKN